MKLIDVFKRDLRPNTHFYYTSETQRLTKKKNEYDEYYKNITESLKTIEGFEEQWLDDSFLERTEKELRTNIVSLNGIKTEIDKTDKTLTLRKQLLEVENGEKNEKEVRALEESLENLKNNKKNTEYTIENKEKIITT